MKLLAPGMGRWLALAVGIVVLDQVTKQLVSASLAYRDVVPVLGDYLYVTRVHNTGAAFSFLAGAGGWQRWFFVAVAILVSGIILAWLRRMPPDARWAPVGLSLVLGGALGNVWDRAAYGYVVDFIQVYLPFLPWPLFNPWPAFNVADSAISIGVVMLIVDAFRGEKAIGAD